MKPDSFTNTCGKCGASVNTFSPGGVCTNCLVTSVLCGDDNEALALAEEALTDAPEIAGYRITERLGEGGFGEVFAATQMHPVQREVAIKVLKPTVGGDQALARFEAERQALAMMDHPNIAIVYDAGETAGRRPYFVMERISGRSLVDYCREEELPMSERLRLFQEVCAAIGHAHRKGIIHRDIKPTNVLVSEEKGAAPVPKVIDFGIAKATEFLLTERTLFTQHNQLIGTPAYMSPEQAESRAEIDVRSDIYSLGVLLYELATGSPPFRDTDLHALPYDEALRKIRTESPPLPSVRVRESGIKPDIGSDLDWIVMKTIQKDPVLRYETAEALARDLTSFLEGGAIEARPPTTGYRLRKFVGRNRLAVGAACGITLALLAGTIVSMAMYFRAEENAEKAVANDLRGRRQFSLAEFKTAGNVVDSSPALAVAHLARALRTDPENDAAAIRLLHLLASEDWPIQAFDPIDYGRGVRELAFSTDGERVFVIGNGGRLDIHDATSGTKIRSVQLAGDCFTLAVSPDGIHVATLVSWIGVEVINVLTGEQVATIDGKPRGGGNVRFSEDGTLLGCAFDGGDAHVWDVKKRELVQTIKCGSRFARIAFSPDGNQLVVASDTGVQLAEDNELSDLVLPFEASVNDVEFSPDGALLVVRCADEAIRVVDLESRGLLAKMPHGAAIESFALSPDGALLVTGSHAGMAQVWELRTGDPVGEPMLHRDDIIRATFSPDGRWVLSAGNGNNADWATVRIWDARTGERICSPIFHPRGASDFAFSPDGQSVVLGSRSKLVTGWNIRARSMRPLRLSHREPVWKVDFDDSNARILTLMPGGKARAWDAETGEALATEPQTVGDISVAAHANRGHSLRHGFSNRRIYHFAHRDLQNDQTLIASRFREGDVRAAAASDDGEKLATGGADGSVRVWSLRDGMLLRTLVDEDGESVSAVAFDMTGRIVAAGYEDGGVRAWSDRGLIIENDLHEKRVTALSISENGAFLASGSKDGTARILMLSSGAVGEPLVHTDAVAQLSFSPDQLLLATSGPENAARVWSVPEGKSQGPPLAHLDRVSTSGLFLLWTPDSRRLVTTASNDNTARLWDVRPGRQLTEPMSQPAAAYCAALDPGGELLLFGSNGTRNTRLWDIHKGQPLTPLALYDAPSTSCAFSSNGTRYAVATMSGSVFVNPLPQSNLDTAKLLQLADQLGGFRFNSSGILERTQFAPVTPAQTDDHWLAWLAADSSHRSIAPGLRLTQDAYIENLKLRGRTSDLRDALRWRPNDPDILFRFGDRLAKTGRAPASGSFLVDRAVKMNPENQALRQRAIEHWLANRSEAKAYLEFTGSLAAEGGDRSAAWLALGRGLSRIGSIFDAKIALTEAKAAEDLATLEKSLKPHHRRRWALVKKDDAHKLLATLSELTSSEPFQAVRSTIDTALAADPDDAVIWARLGEHLVAVSQHTDDTSLLSAAIPCLISGAPSAKRIDQLTSRVGEDSATFTPEDLSLIIRRLELNEIQEAWMRGCLAHHQGEYQQAAKHFSEASRLLPKRPLVENRLGVAHYRLNDLDKAAAAFERALQAAGGEMPTLSLTLRQNLHFVLRKLGRDKDAQKHWLVLNRVPSRPHKLTSASIDLSQHYNAALDRDWFDPRYTNSLVELQPGVHRFDGVEFDVRGLIQLASTVVDKNRFPTSADIIVDQKCTAIHFLYGAIHATDPDNTTIGSCRVIFKDGSSRELPLEMGKNIRDWWAPLGAKESLNLPEATCVWVGTNPTIEPRKLQLCILKTTWNNESQQTVDRLEVSTTMRKGAPFLVAVSLEKSSHTD